MLSNLIGGFIAIIMGIALIGPITSQMQLAISNSSTLNSSSFASTALQLVPGLFAVTIVAIGIAMAFSSLRDIGLLGGEEQPTEPEPEEHIKLETKEYSENEQIRHYEKMRDKITLKSVKK